MSQNNTDFSNDMSGVELLDDYLTPLQENINTSNSGVQRPSYARKGTIWLDTSSAPALYKMYAGEKDVVIGKVGDTFQPATPLTITGDILIQGADGNLNKLAAGATGTVLTSNGTGQLPSYQVNPIGILTYSASYTYKKKDIVVSTSEDDETALYKSLVDSNVGNVLTDDTKWEKLLLGGSGLPIGSVLYTLRTDVPNGGAWCDGAEYTKEAFPDIYQMLVDGKLQSTTYQNFTSSVSTNGSCGFFALDSSSQKFKVPLLKDVYLKAGQTPLMFGAESLPNIKWQIPTNQSDLDVSGTLQQLTGQASLKGFSGTSQRYTNAVSQDASKASNAYQDGAKVNPEHVVYKAYVVLYASAAEASVAQAQEFMTALGGKANVDLSNVSENIDYVVESGSSGENFWRKWKSGVLEQWGITSKNGTNTFPKPFSNTDYKIIRNPVIIGTEPVLGVSFNPANKTTTTFDVFINAFQTSVEWYAIGQGA